MLNYTKQEILTMMEGVDRNWYPTVNDRQAWEAVPEAAKKEIINQAEGYLNFQWMPLPATLYLDFTRTGNRVNYENVVFERRKVLGTLMMAELFEDKGRFLDALIDAVWATCEESTWAIPASNFIDSVTYRPLPDVDEEIVELFSTETGVQIAFIYNLLGSRLDAVTPLITKRMKYELEKRIIRGYLQRDDFMWMGITHSNRLNNWAPWCSSNVLMTATLSGQTPEVLAEVIAKSMKTVQRFIDGSNDDGGCDEGASYWDRAGASMFECLDFYYRISNGKIDLFGEEKIKALGQFIKYMHISDKWFVNFSDGHAKVTINSYVAYLIGKRIHDDDLCSMAAEAYDAYLTSGLPSIVKSPMRGVPGLLSANEIMKHKGQITQVKEKYLSRTQVMVARRGTFFLAAKGGFNEESHNHNDVGQFILFRGGKPVFVDVGVGAYSKKTFSEQRYEIWTMQSRYHNLPTLNGVQQHHGFEYTARNTAFAFDEDSVQFSLDIAKAYPDACECQQYLRTLVLNENSFILKDEFAFQQDINQIEFSFLTLRKAEIQSGAVVLEDVTMEFDSRLSCSIEEIDYQDERLQTIWEIPMRRIVFTAEVGKAGEFQFVVR